MDKGELPPIISHEAMEELRALAVPIARFIALHGLLHSEVRIDTLGITVLSLDAGRPFTCEEEARIFQEQAVLT